MFIIFYNSVFSSGKLGVSHVRELMVTSCTARYTNAKAFGSQCILNLIVYHFGSTLTIDFFSLKLICFSIQIFIIFYNHIFFSGKLGVSRVRELMVTSCTARYTNTKAFGSQCIPRGTGCSYCNPEAYPTNSVSWDWARTCYSNNIKEVPWACSH